MKRRERQQLAGQLLRMQADGDRSGMNRLRAQVGEDAMREVAEECQDELIRRAHAQEIAELD